MNIMGKKGIPDLSKISHEIEILSQRVVTPPDLTPSEPATAENLNVHVVFLFQVGLYWTIYNNKMEDSWKKR